MKLDEETIARIANITAQDQIITVLSGVIYDEVEPTGVQTSDPPPSSSDSSSSLLPTYAESIKIKTESKELHPLPTYEDVIGTSSYACIATQFTQTNVSQTIYVSSELV